MKEALTILLVESSAQEVARFKSALLKCSGKYELTEVGTLSAAKEKLEQESFDLFFVAVHLQDSTGIKNITSLMERSGSAPAIALLSPEEEATAGTSAIKAGAIDVLVRGNYDASTLGRLLRSVAHQNQQKMQLEQNNAELSDTRRRMSDLRRFTQTGYWDMELLNSEMTWSQEIFDFLGLNPDTTTPQWKTYVAHIHPEDRKTFQEIVAEVRKDGQPRLIEHRVNLPNKKVRFLRCNLKAIADPQTHQLTLSCLVQDISERRNVDAVAEQKNLKDSFTELRGKLLDGLNFNVRTPLNSLLNLAYLLEQENSADQRKELSSSLATSVHDLSAAVNQLLNFTVLVGENVKVDNSKFHLREHLDGLVRMMRFQAEAKKLTISLALDVNLPEYFNGDANKLYQILYNLLDNAIKFSDEEGEIRISAERLSRQPDGAILVGFEVRDYGKGMSPTKQEAVMERMLAGHTAGKAGEPTGLAISNKLANVMGGQLSFKSRTGRGTTVAATLPLLPAKVGSATQLSKDAPEQALRVLLVEDHPINQMTVRKLLTAWSPFVSVDTANNGKIALEKWESNAGEFELVLMDLQMPVMDGNEATKRLRQSNSAVPIIALTANSSKSEEEACLKNGFTAYLAKPFKPDELFSKIMEVMESR